MAATTETTRPAAPSLDRSSQGLACAAPGNWLAEATWRAGILLDDAQLARFDRYRQSLIDWNSRTNLTAVTDPHEIDRRLFLDALLALPTLDRVLLPSRNGRRRLVDIGSGAGFPGLVIKIARPELDVTLIEATGKKVRFLSHLIDALDLEGIVAQHARAEDLGHLPHHRGAYDLATARAVASLPALIELSVPLLRVGGYGLFPKGLDLADELAAGGRAATQLGARIRASDLLPGSETRLIAIEKTEATPSGYPRRAGIPAREPLGVARPSAPPLVPSGPKGGER